MPLPLSPAESLVRLAREHGFSLRASGPDLDESGADFVVAHATDDDGAAWIVKAPRRPDVAMRADGERRALGLVRPHLPVDVPDWRLFTPDLIAYPRVPGSPAAVADLEVGDWVWRFDQAAPPDTFLDSVAGVLAALHRIDPAEAADARLIVLRPDDIREATAERVVRARDGLRVPEPVWRRWHEWIADDSSWPSHAVVVHGDLHPGHILIDDEHRATGILDWSEAHVGDPATDFSLLYASIGLDPLTALLGRYTAAGGHVWPRMAHHVVERWCAYPAVIADFARMTGDDQPMQLAQALVDESAARMAQ
jgi:macrolide phosphotransferase